MKKKFRFVMDFDVEIKEQIEVKDKETGLRLNLLLQEFLKNDRAILDIYKLFFLGDLQSDEHLKAVEAGIAVRDEKDILRSVFKELPVEIEQHFLKIVDSNNNNLFQELDRLFDQFSKLRFSSAGFSEV